MSSKKVPGFSQLFILISLVALFLAPVAVIADGCEEGAAKPDVVELLPKLSRSDWQVSLAKLPDQKLRNLIAQTVMAKQEEIAGGSNSNMEELSVFGGAPGPVLANGDLAYAVFGRVLYIFNVSNPSYPSVLGQHLLPESGWDMDFLFPGDGRILLCIANGSALRVLDVTGPVAIEELGADYQVIFAHSVATDGVRYAYVADGDGLVVYDLLDPKQPAKVAFFNTAGWSTWVEWKLGGMVVVTTGDAEVYFVDISNPRDPREVEVVYSVSMPWVYGCAIYWPYVIIAEERELVFIDASNINKAHVISRLDVPDGGTKQVVISGDFAWVATTWGMVVVAIRNPFNPKVVGGFDADGYVPRLAVENVNRAYLTDARGLRVLNVSDPTHPWETGTYHLPGLVERVTVAEGVAYVSAYYSGLHTVVVADPESPAPLGYRNYLWGAQGVAVRRGYAYVTTGQDRMLEILNISNPAYPFFMGGQFFPGSTPQDVVLSHFGSVAFVVSGRCDFGGLYALDVCDPQRVQTLGFSDTPGSARRVVLAVRSAREYAFIADGDMEVRIIDVTYPRELVEVGHVLTGGWVYDVAVHDNLAFIATGQAGLAVVDVTNLSRPEVLTYVSFPDPVEAVAVEWPYVFVGWGGNVEALRFYSGTYFVRAGFYEGRGWVEDIFVGDDGTLFLASDYGGLVALRHWRQPEPGYHLALPLLAK